MGGDANGARDLFAPVEVFKEVLTEALACHGGNSVAGEVTSDGRPAKGELPVESGKLNGKRIVPLDLGWQRGVPFQESARWKPRPLFSISGDSERG
jgi:hypothetical protein